MRLGGIDDPLHLDLGSGNAGNLDLAGIMLGKGEMEASTAKVLESRESEREEEHRAERKKAELKEEKAEKISALIFCPPGQKPNPSLANVPAEARAMAVANGVPQCLPDAAAGSKPGEPGSCYFAVGAKKKYKCTAGGFGKAVAYARSQAKGGKVALVLHVNNEKISLAKCIVGSGGVRRGGMMNAYPAPAGQVVYATPAQLSNMVIAPPGTATCPANFSAVQDPQGRTVCAPTAAVAQAGLPAAAAPSAPGVPRRKGRHGGKRHMNGLGDNVIPQVQAEAEEIPALIKRLQMGLRSHGFKNAAGQLPRASGVLDPSTMQAINRALTAAGRPGNFLPITAGEILVNIDKVVPVVESLPVLQGAQGCLGCPGCAGCGGDLGAVRRQHGRRVMMRRGGRGGRVAAASAPTTCPPGYEMTSAGCYPIRSDGYFGDAQASNVMVTLPMYGGPNIPNWMLNQDIPNAQWTGGKPVVTPNLATYGCPPGYFPTQRGCTAYSSFTSGSGPARANEGMNVEKSLRPYHLAPRLPNWMLTQQVPGQGMRSSWG